MKKNRKDRADDHAEVPNEESWGKYWANCDCALAYETFGGKTIDEMRPFFLGSMLGAWMYFEKMPAVPFRYYIQVFERILTSQDMLANDNSEIHEAAQFFMSLIRLDLKAGGERVVPIMDRLMPLVEDIGTDPTKYHIDETFDPSVPDIRTTREECDEIKELFAKVIAAQKP